MGNETSRPGLHDMDNLHLQMILYELDQEAAEEAGFEIRANDARISKLTSIRLIGQLWTEGTYSVEALQWKT